jgi:hypothetical protein
MATVLDLNLSGLAGDFEILAVPGTVVALSAVKIKPNSGKFIGGARGAMIQNQVAAGAIVYRLDGGDPVVADANTLAAGDSVLLHGSQNLEKFRALRSTSTSGKLLITYFY